MSHELLATCSTAQSDGNDDEYRDGQDDHEASFAASRRALLEFYLADNGFGKAALSKQLQYLDHMMANLDMLVIAELCVLYYMDCSMFRFAVRAFAQYTFLTPKDDNLERRIPQLQPWAPVLIASNLLCIILHLTCALPVGLEALRGYLHGGILIDFIGQKAPVSKVGLVLLDLVVLALQCVMCAVWVERARLRTIMASSKARNHRRNSSATEVGSTARRNSQAEEAETVAFLPRQDHDAEERGLRVSDDFGAAYGEDSFGDDDPYYLRPRDDAPAHNLGDDREWIERAVRNRRQSALYDRVVCGTRLLTLPRIGYAIRALSGDHTVATAYTLRLIGYFGTLARVTARSIRILQR